MPLTRPASRRAPVSRSGFTIVELLVTLVVMGVIATAVGRLFVSQLRNYSRTREAVEIGMADDCVDLPHSLYERAVDHLRAGAMLRFRSEHEARIGAKMLVLFVIVVVDPDSKARSERVDEGTRDLVEAAARLPCERDVEHGNAPVELTCLGKLPRCAERQLHGVNAWGERA